MPEAALFSVKPVSVEIAASSGSPISLSARFSLEADIRSQKLGNRSFQPSRKTGYGLSVKLSAQKLKNSNVLLQITDHRCVEQPKDTTRQIPAARFLETILLYSFRSALRKFFYGYDQAFASFAARDLFSCHPVRTSPLGTSLESDFYFRFSGGNPFG